MSRKPMKLKKEKIRVNVASWIEWRATILRYCPAVGSPWTEESAAAFYCEHREAILEAYLEMRRERNQPFRRPEEFWGELEKKHPRKKVGVERWFGPWSSAGPPKKETVSPVFETDEQYLKRLGLAEEWEREIN